VTSFEEIAHATLKEGGFTPTYVNLDHNSKYWFEMSITFGGVMIRIELDKGLMGAFGSEERFLEHEIKSYFPALTNAGVKDKGLPGEREDTGTD